MPILGAMGFILFAVMIWYAVVMDETQAKVGPKDVFLHVLAIATLYASAISFVTLMFQYVNLHFPGVGENTYYFRDSIEGAIRFAVATLIVVFPVYFWLSRMLRKMYEADPARRNLGIRKWLSYFTLFLAGAIAIGWLVGVIYKFLEGDFTVAFLLKALAIFFTTGSIFFYYRAVTHGEENKPSVRNYGYLVSVIIAVAVITAFFMVGSPQERRLQKFDVRRLEDLQNIQAQIGSYFQSKDKLPAALTDLNDAFRGVEIPKDPETGTAYEYRAIGPAAFELCATFHFAWDSESGSQGRPYVISEPYGGYYGPIGNNWQHGAGRHCFSRTIDADFLQPPMKPAL